MVRFFGTKMSPVFSDQSEISSHTRKADCYVFADSLDHAPAIVDENTPFRSVNTAADDASPQPHVTHNQDGGDVLTHNQDGGDTVTHNQDGGDTATGATNSVA